MANKGSVFKPSRPPQLGKTDWGNDDHKRIVASSLVEGVYAGERARQQNPQAPGDAQAAASEWAKSYDFKVKSLLINDDDSEDSSIFGIIYEFKPPTAAANAPSYVIAFRGMLFTRHTAKRDIKLAARFVVAATLHRATRFHSAMEAVRDAISADRPVWLAGHSLGASLATMVGKNMVREGVFLESFLFNPPYPSCLVSKIKGKELQQWTRISHSFLRAWLAVTVGNKGNKKKSGQESCANLSSWVPYVFLNPGDRVCSEYIAYFEHREKMEGIGAGQTERIASQNPVRTSFRTMFGKDSDPVHTLPSATLIINRSPSKDLLQNHANVQWCQPDLQLECKTFLYE